MSDIEKSSEILDRIAKCYLGIEVKAVQEGNRIRATILVGGREVVKKHFDSLPYMDAYIHGYLAAMSDQAHQMWRTES